MKIFRLLTTIIIGGSLSCASIMAQDKITVYTQQKGASISPSLYGIFFEEINRSGDGGLYAELVQNRSFEDLVIYDGWHVEGKRLHARKVMHHFTNTVEDRTFAWPSDSIPGWSLEVPNNSSAQMTLTREQSKYRTAPTNLKLTIDKNNNSVTLVNSGFWGMGIAQNKNYNLRMIIRTSEDYNGKVTAQLLSSDKKVIATTPITLRGGRNWEDLRTTLYAKQTDGEAQLALEFSGEGVIWLDYVSLFPEDTYNNRPNGFRKDVAQLLADLKPAFVRWPGGSIVGGITLDNRFDWKKTLGDPASRPGEYVTWGYRCSYGMGYYETLQFCEDIGAKAMYVCNVGLSDLFRSGEACSEDSITYFLNDCLDAIEYALGDDTTEWGARRVADGHQKPFPLEYVEIGNEHWGKEYDRRFDMFYRTIKEKYPQLTLISNHPLWGIENSKRTDMVDPHWYGTPEFFFRNTAIFDSVPRGKYDVYIGEWACNFGVGKGNMRAALAEAAFINNIEKNGDLVKMTSFAPLLQNRHKKDWPVNLIWLDTDQVVGRSSYYVQKMASENRPTYNVRYQYTGASVPVKYEKGKIGFGSSKTTLEITDIKITENNQDFIPDLSNSTSQRGMWSIAKDTLKQNSMQGSSMYILEGIESNNFTLECKVKKHSFKEGIFLYYGLTDSEQKGFVYNVGCWNSNSIAIEQLSDGHNIGSVGKAVEYSVLPYQWYELKLVVTPTESTLYVNSKKVLNHTPKSMPKQFVASGIDELTHELVLKVINRDNQPYIPLINIEETVNVEKTGKVISLSAKDDKEENSFEEPFKIYPQEIISNNFGKRFKYEFAPYSYTIMRVKIK